MNEAGLSPLRETHEHRWCVRVLGAATAEHAQEYEYARTPARKENGH